MVLFLGYIVYVID